MSGAYDGLSTEVSDTEGLMDDGKMVSILGLKDGRPDLDGIMDGSLDGKQPLGQGTPGPLGPGPLGGGGGGGTCGMQGKPGGSDMYGGKLPPGGGGGNVPLGRSVAGLGLVLSCIICVIPLQDFGNGGNISTGKPGGHGGNGGPLDPFGKGPLDGGPLGGAGGSPLEPAGPFGPGGSMGPGGGCGNPNLLTYA